MQKLCIGFMIVFIISAAVPAGFYFCAQNKENKVSVVYIIGESYSLPVSASINSMLKNKAKNTVYDINIIGVELPKAHIDALEKLSTEKATVKVISKPAKPYRQDLYDFTMIPLYKFDIPEIFPDKQKILYLDADTLVLKDLAALYHTDIKGKYAAVVRDAVSYLMGGYENPIPNGKNHFSSATMLLNLDKIRKDNLKNEFIKFNTEDKRRFMDNAFNEIFAEEVIYVSPSYNFENIQNAVYPLQKVSDFHHLSLSEYIDVLLSPHILHFIGYTKPWLRKGLSPNYKLWEDYLPLNKEVFYPK